jgi:hypothetical protein
VNIPESGAAPRVRSHMMDSDLKTTAGIMEKAAKSCKEFNEQLSVRKKVARGKRKQPKGRNTGLLSKLNGSQIKALSADQLRSLISECDESPSKRP